MQFIYEKNIILFKVDYNADNISNAKENFLWGIDCNANQICYNIQ